MTREEILTALLAAYTGPGSTEEGSFAGDVLRACADGMEQLWSMEVDGLEYRAFVSTATGDWLTKVCADRGLPRREGEGDEALRTRALAALRTHPASGNADHYRAWCGRVPDILRVEVYPLARGNGTVDVVAVNAAGRAPSRETLAEAQAIVDAERPVGADAQVKAAVEHPLAVSGTVTLMSGATLSAVQEAFGTALASFCREMALRTNTVSYAKTLRLLMDCEGVADVTGFTLEGGSASVTLAAREIPVCGVLSLKEARA